MAHFRTATNTTLSGRGRAPACGGPEQAAGAGPRSRPPGAPPGQRTRQQTPGPTPTPRSGQGTAGCGRTPAKDLLAGPKQSALREALLGAGPGGAAGSGGGPHLGHAPLQAAGVGPGGLHGYGRRQSKSDEVSHRMSLLRPHAPAGDLRALGGGEKHGPPARTHL